MKKIYLTILSIATAILCVAGLLYHIGYLDRLFKSGDDSGDLSESGKLSDTVNLSAFSSVDVDTSFANISFEYGDANEYQVFYRASAQKYLPTVKVSGNTLKITQKVKNPVSGSPVCEIVITVPNGAAMESVEIDNGMGNVEIDLLTAKTLAVTAGMGDVKVSDSVINTVSAEAGMGNVQFHDNTIHNLNISAGMGNVEITGIGDLAEYTFDIDHGMGSLSVGGTTMNGLGREYIQSGTTSKKITIDAGMGSVAIEE